ncbi:MAG: hypothetical protein GXO50_01690 [Chlorobi bacterium]|nr:hypothetical protein [Chlorobiota bacterium]
MKNILKITLISAAVFFTLSGCVKEDFDTTPEYVTDWVANTSIADLKAKYPDVPATIDEDIIIKGIVVSNDEYGNFYKELFIEDETGAIGIELDDGYLYEKYPVGRLVYVKCKGLSIGSDYGVPKLGLGLGIDRINSALIEDYVDISAGGTPVEPKITDIAELSANNGSLDSLLGCYIQINDVQFTDSDTTYAVEGEFYSEREIEDCSGNTVIMSTSEYADFRDERLPAGKGSIKAILSVFRGDYQLRINSPEDIDFTGERCSK